MPNLVPEQTSQPPHDIRGLLPKPKPWGQYAAFALAAFVLLSVLWSLLRRRRRPEQDRKSDPWQEIANSLDSLRLDSVFEARHQVEVYSILSLCLRQAASLRLGMNATEMTTSEVRDPFAKRLPLSHAEVEQVLAWLEKADLVKFAGVTVSVEAANSDVQLVKRWVEDLKPKHDLAPDTAQVNHASC